MTEATDSPGNEPERSVQSTPRSEDVLRRLLAGLTDLRDGNFRRRLVFSGTGVPAEIATVFNELAERDQHLVSELRRVSEAASNGERPVPPVEFRTSATGDWSAAAGAVNNMLQSLLSPLDELERVLGALGEGDLSQRMSHRTGDVVLPGSFGQLSTEVNAILEQLSLLCDEIARVAREVAVDGRLGGSVRAPSLVGRWGDTASAVDAMVNEFTIQVREIAQVARAVGAGDFSRRMGNEATGELADLREVVNAAVDRLALFNSEITRVTREVTNEGQLGGQARVPAESGAWRELTDSINTMHRHVTHQVRGVSRVVTAVANGDLTQRVDVDARGEVLALKNTVNSMVDQLSAFTDEIDRLAREVGVDGKLGGQARVHGLAGAWKNLTDDVNTMADNLTSQLRSIGGVATAVAGGDLSKKTNVSAKGEVASLAETINDMVDTLSVFAAQVTQVAREVGTEGVLGGQARVPNVAGTWKDLTDNVNIMARNLTNQVRDISQVTTAVARGDLSRRIDVDARGEILELKTTINTMVSQLSAFASEVTRVAREVGTEGNLGGQAEVADISGTWRRLTESVNRLAGNLTTQVRAIATVATAVTNGDLTQRITVHASGEVAELKDNLNEMIRNLRESTRVNQEQDWLKSNFARLSAMMKGQHDVSALAQLILRELAALVEAPHGVFYVGDADSADNPVWQEVASYGTSVDRHSQAFQGGETLVGQAAEDNRTIVVDGAPVDYPWVSSGLGGASATHLVIVPIPFEQQVLGVLELAAFHEFSQPHLDLLEQLKETIGVDVNTIVVNSRTESLLSESQHLAAELRQRSDQLQRQQSELRRSNTELEEKAALLASRNSDIELKNQEIEQARQQLEERARQLSEASAYKSEFLANMSHELRTPLNSVLLLAKLLADNNEGTLTDEQVELASTIHRAGSDLLELINDVLDLSKVEAGRMRLLIEDVSPSELANRLESLYRPLAEDKGLSFEATIDPGMPAFFRTDHSRIEQVLRNLLANAVKFTDVGGVELDIRLAEPDEVDHSALRGATWLVAFTVRDSGVGIPAEQSQQIFEAFQQVDGTVARRHGGTGLGLSISQEIAGLLGGELRVRSQQGEGSTFTLYVPPEPLGPSVLEAADESADTATTDPTHTTPGSPAGTRSAPVSEVDSGPAGELEPPPSANVGQDDPADAEDTRDDEVVWDAEANPVDPEMAVGAAKQGRPAHDVTTVEATSEQRPRQAVADTTSPPGQRAEPTEDTEGTIEPAQWSGNTGRFAGETVLIVDDDPRGMHAIATLLETYGLRAVRAESGAAALCVLQQRQDVRAVLMDVMMPEMDGNTTIRFIREVPRLRDMAVIAVTAQAREEDRQRSLDAGADAFLSKPVDAERLLRALARELGASGVEESAPPAAPGMSDADFSVADSGETDPDRTDPDGVGPDGMGSGGA